MLSALRPLCTRQAGGHWHPDKRFVLVGSGEVSYLQIGSVVVPSVLNAVDSGGCVWSGTQCMHHMGPVMSVCML